MRPSITHLILSFWNYADEELRKGELPVFINHLQPDLLSENRIYTFGDVVNIPLNRSMLGRCRYASMAGRSAFFEELATRGFYLLTQNWATQARDQEDYRTASGYLELQNLSPEHVIWNGICSAIQFSCRSLTTLLQSGDIDAPDACLQLFESAGLKELHIDFIKKIARSWPPIALTTAIKIFSKDLTWSDSYNLKQCFPDIIRTSERLIKTTPKGALSPDYLTVRHTADKGSPNIPYLDFCAEKITAEHLRQMHSGRVVFGCPAGPILHRFLDWIFKGYDEFVLQPVDDCK